MMIKVIENGIENIDASKHFPVWNGVKQSCVLTATWLCLRLAEMPSFALCKINTGIKINMMTDGHFFDK